ncbi:ABC transporter permease [Haloimpatiens sp. FM7330]|uniref:ABC transporter permease n=1 Tax=Haloimpatiens sp. FM7330 TaxID=3298610 RepID=UPI003634A767
MKNIFLIMKNILKQAFRKKSNIITFMFLPILGVFISLGLNNTGASYTKVGIVNLNNTYLSKDMIKSIDENKNFIIREVEEEKIENNLLNKRVDCVLVIPKNFDKSIYEGNLKQLEVVSIRGKDVTAWIENYANYYLDTLVKIGKASNNNKQIFKKIYDGYNQKKLKLQDVKIKDKSQSKSVTKQSIGLLLVFMLMASSVTSNFIMKDKFNRTYFRIFCAPVTKVQYIIANVIANFIIFLMQISLILLISIKVFKLDFYINVGTMFFILSCFGLVSIGFGIIIAAFSKSMAQSAQMSNVLITPTCMLSGCFWPLEMMPNFLQKLANIFPQTWILKTINSLQYGKTLNEVVIYLVLVVIFAIILFQVGIIKMIRDENLKNVI